MLMISRKIGERVMIGDDVTIKVTDVRRDGSVKLAIDAPRDVEIWREEIYQAKQAMAQKGKEDGR